MVSQTTKDEPVQNGRSKGPRAAASAQEDVPDDLRVRLSLRVACEPHATRRTSDRERHDFTGLLTRFNPCREESTVWKVRARKEWVVDRAACLKADQGVARETMT